MYSSVSYRLILAVFLVARLGVCPVVIWVSLLNPKTSIAVKVLIILFMVFSVDMAYGIVRVIIKNGRRGKEMREKEV